VIIEDSNPSKENEKLEKVILEDLELLQIKYDSLVHTSDHFDLISTYCEQLLRKGKAYVDDTDPETMKREREQRMESGSIVKSSIFVSDFKFVIWMRILLFGREMKHGTDLGKRCCVRAKICTNAHE